MFIRHFTGPPRVVPNIGDSHQAAGLYASGRRLPAQDLGYMTCKIGFDFDLYYHLTSNTPSIIDSVPAPLSSQVLSVYHSRNPLSLQNLNFIGIPRPIPYHTNGISPLRVALSLHRSRRSSEQIDPNQDIDNERNAIVCSSYPLECCDNHSTPSYEYLVVVVIDPPSLLYPAKDTSCPLSHRTVIIPASRVYTPYIRRGVPRGGPGGSELESDASRKAGRVYNCPTYYELSFVDHDAHPRLVPYLPVSRYPLLLLLHTSSTLASDTDISWWLGANSSTFQVRWASLRGSANASSQTKRNCWQLYLYSSDYERLAGTPSLFLGSERLRGWSRGYMICLNAGMMLPLGVHAILPPYEHMGSWPLAQASDLHDMTYCTVTQTSKRSLE
ncbi:hypothetical protein DFJ58DRAFT_843123 [Suillus subalutaceus]|uniref:uncharacterized protein n=1 Tax=Suillus subalutaceus TaxID=48586 RepID=UPI001B879C20|nr:uncharacterized protein DFJ58DRAFT_843123 [Suillus subalutaceus]KAG1847679.1 hypothetical protein DFJ58DRAFT_843123 [Suillus subalutaceus]